VSTQVSYIYSTSLQERKVPMSMGSGYYWKHELYVYLTTWSGNPFNIVMSMAKKGFLVL
jgi:hypothetical protein